MLVSTALEAAAASFELGLRGLGLSGDECELGDVAQFGLWAAQAAVAGARWHARGIAADDPQSVCLHCGPASFPWHVRFGPLLDVRHAMALLDIPTHEQLDELIQDHRLLAFSSHAGQLVVPVFQFGEDARPYAGLPAVLEALAAVDITGWKVATWLFAHNPQLDGTAPHGWLKAGRDLPRVLEATRTAPADRAAAAAARG
jgi:hypothetical protein